jgi:hypothetical protein
LIGFFLSFLLGGWIDADIDRWTMHNIYVVASRRVSPTCKEKTEDERRKVVVDVALHMS